ncbi:CPBP family intramembrane glutamic endopeptidase [Pseudoclavibacter terrae]|uniref:CPBP family intramembrane metalloprotease n=1 Tax=Pseudoclavibacter terrae TaxID=1530195 RepID=A0A7J5AXG4_9MICO|nr:type II CAAX endopeptidase family protein [Pseudoclavibacter terrae]KAB1636163.1 CPBP family intramembrane metalloprotease [Pseudoclavibacter terrae]
MTSPHRPRLAPRVWLGVVAYLTYLAVFYGVWIANGIDYPRIGDNADTLWKWYVAPTLAGAVVISIIVTVYGWWRPAVFEERKRMPKWAWAFPVILVAVALANLLLGDTSRFTPTMWLLLAAGSLLVGFNEELLTRGQLIVALRSRFGELGVWFFSTLLFGLLHLPNTIFGTGPLGVSQVFITFVIGSALYLLRRVSGTLIAAMALHALWDFSSFAANTGLIPVIGLPISAAAMIAVIIWTRKESNADKIPADTESPREPRQER